MIRLEHVQKSFGATRVLKDVSFSVGTGERVSLIGPGGCGKSTILKLILGLERADAGLVQLMNLSMANASDRAKREVLRQTGVAFQQGALFDFMTVRDNLAFAMSHMTDLGPDAIAARTKELLEGVKLGRTEALYPYELSGGMQRRVGIARALATEPVVAIFDEPTAGLDPVTSTIILNMIRALGESKERTLLVATSNVEIAMRFAERMIIIDEGRVVGDGPWRSLLLEGSTWVRHFLSVRLIGLDYEYALGLDLPQPFLAKYWTGSQTSPQG